MAKTPSRLHVLVQRIKNEPTDPTDELYEQAFTGPREAEPSPEEQLTPPISWWEISSAMLGSTILVCLVGVASVVLGW